MVKSDPDISHIGIYHRNSTGCYPRNPFGKKVFFLCVYDMYNFPSIYIQTTSEISDLLFLWKMWGRKLKGNWHHGNIIRRYAVLWARTRLNEYNIGQVCTSAKALKKMIKNNKVGFYAHIYTGYAQNLKNCPLCQAQHRSRG